jgi:nicotinamide-nucleotide amidase
MTLATEAVTALRAAGATVATAESLTGGLACATLVSVPGASVVVRGGVVAYASEIKTTLLGVDAALIDERGTVDADVAAAMARGARARIGATYGLATTGVAGPDPSEGKPPGTVHIAVAGPHGTRTRLLTLDGDREAIRSGTVGALLSLLVATLGEESRIVRG